MRGVCARGVHHSRITLFRNNHPESELVIAVPVVNCPKLLMTQRICGEQGAARIVITLFNYEPREFTNLILTHRLKGVPFTYLDIVSADPFSVADGVISVAIENLPPLSCRSVIISVRFLEEGDCVSIATLKACLNGQPEVIASRSCRREIENYPLK